MKPVNGMNDSKVPYFSLEEYVNKIRLTDNVLYHLEDTNISFDKYISEIMKFDDESIIHYWIQSLANELQYSSKMEHHYISPMEVLKNDVYFDNFQMNHSRIKQLHEFISSLDKDYNNPSGAVEDYRSLGQEVRVSSLNEDGTERVYWNGANSEDVKKFMNDFIKIYKGTSLSQVYSNPFLKSALVSFLFVRIHPFNDGNGRTSRLIYNIKFTDFVNKIYGSNLKLCPLNISQNIALYKSTYVERINDIYFDLEHDCNEEINRWFDFILQRVDETLFYNSNKLDRLEYESLVDKNNCYQIEKAIEAMQLRRVRSKI